MTDQILDCEFPPPVYRGGCLSWEEIEDFFAEKYERFCLSEINDHLQSCSLCLAIANKQIEEFHAQAHVEFRKKEDVPQKIL